MPSVVENYGQRGERTGGSSASATTHRGGEEMAIAPAKLQALIGNLIVDGTLARQLEVSPSRALKKVRYLTDEDRKHLADVDDSLLHALAEAADRYASVAGWRARFPGASSEWPVFGDSDLVDALRPGGRHGLKIPTGENDLASLGGRSGFEADLAALGKYLPGGGGTDPTGPNGQGFGGGGPATGPSGGIDVAWLSGWLGGRGGPGGERMGDPEGPGSYGWSGPFPEPKDTGLTPQKAGTVDGSRAPPSQDPADVLWWKTATREVTVKDPQREENERYQAKKADYERTLEVNYYAKYRVWKSASEIISDAQKRAAEEEEKKKEQEKNKPPPKSSNPNPEDPDGPDGPWTRGSSSSHRGSAVAMPTPEGGGPIGPWARGATMESYRWTPNPEDPGGGGPVGPWARTRRGGPAETRFKPAPDDPGPGDPHSRATAAMRQLFTIANTLMRARSGG